MKEQLEQRLQKLKSEFESGQKMLSDLETQQENLKTTLLRISGAIQVLEELLSADREPTENNDRVLEPVGANAQPD
jgi:predicted  nucleic acid-binding Zn-ribbon protein